MKHHEENAVDRVLNEPYVMNSAAFGIVVDEIPIVPASLDFDYKGLLTRLFIQTKTRNWPILSVNEMEKVYREAVNTCSDQILFRKKDTRCLVIPRSIVRSEFVRSPKDTWADKEKNAMILLVEDFPSVKEMLIRFDGKIIAAGGAIFKRLNGLYGGDIDLFFIDPNVDSDTSSDHSISLLATATLNEAITFLADEWMKSPIYAGKIVVVTRNAFVTTVYLITETNRLIKIQFIHRVYPNVGSVLGGFDLTPGMVAWNGQKIMAIEIGAWCALSSTLIIDISRRSTSFEYRLKKYGKYCNIVFPGLNANVRPPHCDGWKSFEDASALIYSTIEEFEFEIKRRERRYYELRPKKETATINERKATLLQEIHELAESKGFYLDNFDSDKLRLTSSEINDGALMDELKRRLYECGYFFNKQVFLYSHGRTPNPGARGANGLLKLDTILRMPFADVNLDNNGRIGYREWNIRPTRAPGTVYKLTESDYDDESYYVRVDKSYRECEVENSDYEDNRMHPQMTVYANLSKLIRGNLDGILTILYMVKSGTNPAVFQDLNLREMGVENPSIESLKPCIIEIDQTGGSGVVRNRIQMEVSKFSNFGNIGLLYNGYVSSIKRDNGAWKPEWFELVGMLFPERRNDYKYVPVTDEELIALDGLFNERMSKISDSHSEVKWILKNPGRQWTSSINPIIADPREWYGHYYNGFRIGNIETESCLKLFRRRNNNYFAMMPKDLFGYLMRFVMIADSYYLSLPNI